MICCEWTVSLVKHTTAQWWRDMWQMHVPTMRTPGVSEAMATRLNPCLKAVYDRGDVNWVKFNVIKTYARFFSRKTACA